MKESTTSVANTANQPQVASEMKVMNVAEDNNQGQPQQQCEHAGHKAWRIRGGGAAKDCFLGALGCFLCFECCEGCCGCIADIVCCPCEMIC